MVKKYLRILSNTELTKYVNNFSSGIDAKTGELLLDSSTARMVLGFDFKSGTLKKSCGLSTINILDYATNASDTLATEFATIGEILKSFIFNKYNDNGNLTTYLILINNSFTVYALNLNDASSGFVQLALNFTSLPKFVEYNLNGEDVIIFCSPTDSMQVWDGENLPYTVADAPNFIDMCMHGERLFALTGDTRTLWFSDDLDPTNWNVSLEDAGFIQMIDQRGALRKIISWNGYIYIFRDFGISRLSANGSQETFSLTHLFTSSGRIYCDTVCECGDRILFLSTDGLYVFDGASTTQILLKVAPLFYKQLNSEACFFDGKYIFSFKIDLSKYGLVSLFPNMSENYVNNAIFIMDVTDLSYQIVFGAEVKNFCVANFTSDEVLMCMSKDLLNASNNTTVLAKFDQSGKILNSPQTRIWASTFDNFNRPNKTKILKSVYITSSCNCILHLYSDKESCDISVMANASPKEYKVMLKGNMFKYIIECNSYSNFEIGQIVFKYYLANICGDR